MIWSGFLLGLLGSLHCLGMCGGLALSSRRRGGPGLFAYQASRLLGYGILGSICGQFGSTTGWWLGGSFVQATAGVLLIVYGLGWLPKLPGGALGRLLLFFAPIMKKPGLTAAAVMGGLTCLLPCGLLGAAYLKAGATLSPLAGAWLMAAFWLGTLPALVLTSTLASWGSAGEKDWRPRILAISMVLMGCLTLFQALAPAPPPCPEKTQRLHWVPCHPMTPS